MVLFFIGLFSEVYGGLKEMSVFRITTVGLSQGQAWNNVFYLDSNLSVEELQEDVDDIVETYRTHLAPVLSVSWSLNEVHARGAEIAGSPTFVYIPTLGPVNGADVTTVAANQVALLVSFSALTLPPNRVRKYIPGAVGQGIDFDGTWVAAVQTAAQAWGDAIVDIGTGDPNTLFPLSARLDENGLVVDSNEMDVAVVREVPATQRRRRIGVGS